MALLKFDPERAEAAIREFLVALGFDPAEPDLVGTPARVTEAYGRELLRGHGEDPREIVLSGSDPIDPSSSPDPVVVDGIGVVTVCPHHLLVADGEALVAYLPGARLLGLGAIARLVDALSRRLVLQEEIAGKVVDALTLHAGARGAYCRIVLRHACLRARGPEEHRAEVISFASRGEFRDPRALELALGRPLGDGA